MYKCGSGQNKAQTPIHSNSPTNPLCNLYNTGESPKAAICFYYRIDLLRGEKSTPQYTGGDSPILSVDFLAIGVIKGGYARKSHSCCFWAYIINPHTNLIQINIYFFSRTKIIIRLTLGLKFKIIEGLDRVWALIGIENEPISLNVTHLSLCFHQEGTFLKIWT